MNDLLKLLDGDADKVKTGLAGKSHDDLLKLREAEQGGKKRVTVLAAIDAAITAAEAQRAGGFVATATTHSTVAADLDTSGPADVAAGDQFSTSGAPRQVTDFDIAHPAVDNDPRSDTTADMNRIDFNDPTRPGHEIVAEQLRAQAKG